ncbi:MAG: glycoside hydrolase family 16 protein, partial [Planctomycetes bacterium]|nr:glycoside hydrolase family 16 protein [Planctomycetota bacterium]
PAPAPVVAAIAAAAPAGITRLLDPAAADVLTRLAPSGQPDAAVRVVDDGGAKAIEFACAADRDYPGVEVRPAAGSWDLSAFSGIEVVVANAGASPALVCLRVDEAGGGSNAWNGAGTRIAAGSTGTVRVRFGESWGKAGHALDAKKVGRVMVYVGKADAPALLRIRSLAPTGKAGDKAGQGPPQAVNTRRPAPEPRVLSFATAPAQERFRVQGAALAVADGTALVTATAAKPEAAYRPQRNLDLRDFDHVVFTVSNPGSAPLRVVCRLDGAQGDRAAAEAVLAAGERREVLVPFASPTHWKGVTPGAAATQGDKPFTGAALETSSNGLVSDAVVAVAIAMPDAAPGSAVVWEGVTAGVSAAFVPPAWLGTRPPVAGDWVQVMHDEFDGKDLDTAVWTPRLPWIGPIPYELQRYSDRNVGVADGQLVIRCEKKSGHLYENPAWPSRDYTTGAVTTYPNWRYRYGYVEARMKRPTALGLWPAFWTMPDRGPQAGEAPPAGDWQARWEAARSNADKNRRRSTDVDGMELDIMEHCTRFGPFRHNSAVHWDGYGKDHKSLGTSRIYARNDADGYIVAGLLWEPGRLAWYCNGEKVGEWSDPRVASVPMALKFTVQMGGWAGNEVDDAALPQDFRIDWVRVWQLREHVPAAQ